jgi:hypothetical protein
MRQAQIAKLFTIGRDIDLAIDPSLSISLSIITPCSSSGAPAI